MANDRGNALGCDWEHLCDDAVSFWQLISPIDIHADSGQHHGFRQLTFPAGELSRAEMSTGTPAVGAGSLPVGRLRPADRQSDSYHHRDYADDGAGVELVPGQQTKQDCERDATAEPMTITSTWRFCPGRRPVRAAFSTARAGRMTDNCVRLRNTTEAVTQ